MRFVVDAWDPAYGSSLDEADLTPTSVVIEPGVELDTSQWRAISCPRAERQHVLFVDGVRRVEARVWIDDSAEARGRPDAEPRGDVVGLGLCASYAAGAVRCEHALARIELVEVHRGVFGSARSLSAIATPFATFTPHCTRSDEFDALSLALQTEMTATEVRVAMAARRPSELVVVDGPLRCHDRLGSVVGLVKTQHTRYLPDSLQPVIGALRPGERTPLFAISGGRTPMRFSWYLRLAPRTLAPLEGVVRLECPGSRSIDDAIALATEVSSQLPLFASEPHKESRAPQNLYPIAGLERVLRHRLGDPQVLYRGLRRSAHDAHAEARL